MTAYSPAVPMFEATPVGVASGRARTWIVGGTLAIAAIAVALVLAFRPWPVRNLFTYDAIAPARDAIWTAMLIDSIAFAGLAIALSLAVCLLARGRGARLANVGAIVTILGGVLFAMGAFAFAAFAWYVTDPTALSVADGGAFLDHAVANPERLMLPQALGFLLHTIGSVLLAVALLRSGAVGRWLPIAILVGTGAQFALHDRALDAAQIVLMGVLVILAVQLVRGPGRAASDRP